MFNDETVLSTDTYDVKVNEWRWSMYIKNDDGDNNIHWCNYRYNLNTNHILEYNTKKFKGFVVLDNKGKNGLFLNVVKVNFEYNNPTEYTHRYKIEGYKSAKDIVLFRYNKKTKKFSIICKKFPDIVFKLKDLKIVSKTTIANNSKIDKSK